MVRMNWDHAAGRDHVARFGGDRVESDTFCRNKPPKTKGNSVKRDSKMCAWTRAMSAIVLASTLTACGATADDAANNTQTTNEELKQEVEALRYQLQEMERTIESGVYSEDFMRPIEDAALEARSIARRMDQRAQTCDGPVEDCGVLALPLPEYPTDTSVSGADRSAQLEAFIDQVVAVAEELVQDCPGMRTCEVIKRGPPPTYPTTSLPTYSPSTGSGSSGSSSSGSGSFSGGAMPSSPIYYLTCSYSVADCVVERQNGTREYASPYRAAGTSNQRSAITRFYDPYGYCYNVSVYDAPKPYAPYVRASRC